MNIFLFLALVNIPSPVRAEAPQTSGSQPCYLVNELGARLALRAGTTSNFRDEIYPENECRQKCQAASIPEDKEACFWGEKVLFAEFPQNLGLCRWLVEPSAENTHLPDHPITQAECEKRMVAARSDGVQCAQAQLRWRDKVWGGRSNLEHCLLCRGWPQSCEHHCTTEADCRASYRKAAAEEEYAFANWDNTFVERKGRASSLGKESCQILDANGKELSADRADQGRPRDCERVCRDTLTKRVNGTGFYGRYWEPAPALPLRCVWNGKELFSLADPCGSFFTGEAPVVTAVVNAETGFYHAAFSFSAAGWENYQATDFCQAKALAKTSFQITWDRRAWGDFPVAALFSAEGKPRDEVKVEDAHGAPATRLPPEAAAKLGKQLKPKLRNKNVVLTTSRKSYRDPLDLKVNAKTKVDLPKLQKILVSQGRVRTYVKNRFVRADPPGAWLELRKAYTGKGGYRLLQLQLDKQKAGLVDAEEEPTQANFFLLERGGESRVIDISERTELVDAGDYNGDGRAELLFLSGTMESGALYLADSGGEILARQSWGDFFGP